MTTPDRTRAERALAFLVAQVRPGWDEPGVLAVLRRCSEKPLAQVAAAAIYCAHHRTDQRKPTVIALDGEHWAAIDRMAGKTGTDRAPEPRCPRHGQHEPCFHCRREASDDAPPERAAEHIAAIRQAIRPSTEE